MRVKKWTMLSRKEILSYPRMQIVEDTVKLPDGRETEYIRFAPCKTHSVAVIAVNDNNEMLLQKEYSYPPNEIMWQLPGGGMKKGEDIRKAANRELAEESGLNAKGFENIGYVYTNNRRSDEKQYIVVCRDLVLADAKNDPEEFIENFWLPIVDVKEMVRCGKFHNINLLAALNIYFLSYLADISIHT